MQLGDERQIEAASHVNDALAAFGLIAEAAAVSDVDEFWLWPENEERFAHWLAVQTQWVVADGARRGLNYAGVESCLRMRGVKRKRHAELFDLIQVMEHAALEAWSEKS